MDQSAVVQQPVGPGTPVVFQPGMASQLSLDAAMVPAESSASDDTPEKARLRKLVKLLERSEERTVQEAGDFEQYAYNRAHEYVERYEQGFRRTAQEYHTETKDRTQAEIATQEARLRSQFNSAEQQQQRQVATAFAQQHARFSINLKIELVK